MADYSYDSSFYVNAMSKEVIFQKLCDVFVSAVSEEICRATNFYYLCSISGRLLCGTLCKADLQLTHLIAEGAQYVACLSKTLE